MMNYESERRPEVVEHVIFQLGEGREVSLELVNGAFGFETTWVARSDASSNRGLRHNPVAEEALSRFVRPELAARMVGAHEAFRELETAQSEESQIEVK